MMSANEVDEEIVKKLKKIIIDMEEKNEVAVRNKSSGEMADDIIEEVRKLVKQ